MRLRVLMPPGPRLAWFGLGDNNGDMPKHEAWKTFSKWFEQYGRRTACSTGFRMLMLYSRISRVRSCGSNKYYRQVKSPG